MTKRITTSFFALIAIGFVTSTNAIAHEGHDHSSPDTPAAESRGRSIQRGVISEPPPFETLDPAPNPVQRMPARPERPSFSNLPLSEPPPTTLPESPRTLPQPLYDRRTPNRANSAFPQNGFAPRQHGPYGSPAFDQPSRGSGQHDNCGHNHGSTPGPAHRRTASAVVARVQPGISTEQESVLLRRPLFGEQ